MNDAQLFKLEEAYATCRDIARREAKNFFYAFRVLPKHKSDAMCAVYAFMRKADDLADDESFTLEQRRKAMAAWTASWRASRGQFSNDPIFLAVDDTQQRFKIPDALFEQLIAGTTLDLAPTQEGVINVAVDPPFHGHSEIQQYKDFASLRNYCYLVASVVGLVCIRIFGYTDPAAEILAEKTGIAFQLTNILRDIKEDAERGRIYLPQDLLHEFGLTNQDVLALANGATLTPHARAMINALSVQAWEYYASSKQLLPLIDADSRPALWVLVKIYSGLLNGIERRQGDVFSTRVRVSTPKKLLILAQGAAQAISPK